MCVLVGITGGMGVGKSALAQMLAEFGALRVDADEVAREVAAIPAVIENLQAAFGRDLLGPDGSLNRPELGRRALRSTEASQRLEAIMRPPISAAIERRLAQVVEEVAGGVVVFDAPLIYEWGNEGNFDRIVVVDAEEERCVSRVQERSGLPVCEIRQRMARQMDPQEKKARADFVIDNNKGLDALAVQAKVLWAELICTAQERDTMTNERLRRTPLYEVAIAEGGRMAPFGGWEMPVQFEGIRSEHWAVRREVGLFDISHMGRIAISGEQGLAFLDSLLPARVRELAIGQMLYAPLCNEQGGCVDDLVVYRLAQQEYLLVVNASRKAADWQWIISHAAGWSDVQIKDLSDEQGMVAVQGPRAAALVESLAGPTSVALGYYRCAVMEIAGIRALLSRNGYTGEDGFEIMCSADQVAALWAKLRAAGARPCGLGARDTLRLEMGFCLYGRELDDQTTPLEAGLAWTLDLEKEANFVGAEALRAQRAAGGYRRLRGFLMLERGIPRPDYPVFDQRENEVGIVTSGTHSPVLGEGIGLAYVQRGAQKIGTQVYIDMKGKRRPAVVVKLPFVPSSIKKD